MNIEELRRFCANHPDNFSIQLKRTRPNLYAEIDNEYSGRNFAEKVYKKLNNISTNPICVHCTNEVKFNSFSTGYNKFCSSKCSAKDKKLNAMVNRKCLNCGNMFSIRKSKDIKTCSDSCRQEYVKSDIHKSNVLSGHKKSIMIKYGVDHISKIDNHGDRVKAAKLAKYGNDSWVNPQKAKETKLTRYGDANYNNQQKMKETLIEKYGTDNYSKTRQFKLAHFNVVVNRINQNYQPLFTPEEYTGVSDMYYKFKCNICDSIFEDYLDNGHQPICKKCNPPKVVSVIEDELVDYIRSMYSGEIIRNSRAIIPPKELDIYIPELKLAIEVNGIYFHSEVTGGKDKKYHLNKTELCNDLGIQLIHITDAEWITKKGIILGILRAKFGKTLHRIYARNTELKTLTHKEYEEFVSKNHLQGPAKASIRYGLYSNGTLVSIMSFSVGRYDTDCYEMIRYCTDNDVTIVGGFSKLLKKFTSEHPSTKLISYCDRRYFDGKIYTTNGFVLSHKTVPGYDYVGKNSSIHNRTKFQKHKLEKVLPVYNETLSEWENMKLAGWDRIWNCGNYKFELNIP